MFYAGSWGRQTMALLEDGNLLVFPNFEAVCQNPGTKNPAIRNKLPLGDFIPMQSIKQLSCGSLHLCLLTASGLVYTWGESTQGALGHGSNVDKLDSPRLVDSMYNVSYIACGHAHTCAIEAESSSSVSYTHLTLPTKRIV
eukprot:TRINITY_DN61272_c0_g1_i3.p2 TRINITY_DN61272_c0_g1~~TRINITY_DN61272_c0_g1_i3.p2  ORF type:complete len:141 (-),score=32.78 TRINITY_DN61272_c0_g1_i3:128-550(-)